MSARLAHAARAAVVAATAIAATLALVGRLAGDPLEPPPETPDGGDYVAELADSLENGSVELRYGFAGDARRSHVRRGVEFQVDSVSGELRGGDDEPLSGGDVVARGGGRALEVGRLAPRWSNGLVLGAPAEPWSHAASVTDPDRARRGPVGEGFSFALVPAGLQVLGGRFGKRTLAAVAWERGPARTGVLADRSGRAQWSLGLGPPETAAELALDRGGAWVAEANARRTVGAVRVALRARGGQPSFRSLGEPKRAGPSRAVGVLAATDGTNPGVVAGLSAWRFAPGVTGARVSAALERRAERSVWRIGWEEQHGPRRVTASAAPRGMRQGAWIECRAGRPPLVLVLRDEVWGRSAFARNAVRRSFEAGAEVVIPGGVTLRAAHAVLEARPGETIYLPEAESDRLVLRAVSGAVRRTRLQLRLPAAEGAIHAGLGLGLARSGARRADWSLQWSRRITLRARR